MRPRDTIHVITGDYSSENVVMASNIAFEGDAFTINSLTVASGVSLSFTQSVSCGTLWLTGQVTMANGASLTSTTAHVAGNLSVIGAGGAFVVTSLDVGAAGLISFSNALLVASAAGVVMNGTFAISNTWGSASAVSVPLPFSDNFELYGDNTVVTNLHFQGWYASDGSVLVTNGVYHAGSKSVVLPDGTLLSNSISTAATKIWTDTYIRPSLGDRPVEPATNTSTFLAYADTNGFLVVATNGGGWVICSNQLNNTLATQIVSTAFTRLTVCQDLSFSPPKLAIFIAGNLVAQGLISPANINRYRSFVADNRNGMASAYMDDMLITTTIPAGLTSDLNQNGIADAYEINNFGLTSELLPRGTIYTFR